MENNLKYYRTLATVAGIGSMLGSGIIVGITFGSLFGGRLAESIGLTQVFNSINFFLCYWGSNINVSTKLYDSFNRCNYYRNCLWCGFTCFIDGCFKRFIGSGHGCKSSFVNPDLSASWNIYFLYLFIFSFKNDWCNG